MDVDCFSLVIKVFKAGDHPVRFRLVVIVPHLCRSNHDLRPFFGLLTPQILIPSEHFNTRNQGIYTFRLCSFSAVFHHAVGRGRDMPGLTTMLGAHTSWGRLEQGAKW
jgi:hypothetical protein